MLFLWPILIIYWNKRSLWRRQCLDTNWKIKGWWLPILIVKSSVLKQVLFFLRRRLNFWNVRLYYPYRQYVPTFLYFKIFIHHYVFQILISNRWRKDKINECLISSCILYIKIIYLVHHGHSHSKYYKFKRLFLVYNIRCI